MKSDRETVSLEWRTDMCTSLLMRKQCAVRQTVNDKVRFFNFYIDIVKEYSEKQQATQLCYILNKEKALDSGLSEYSVR